MFEFSLLFSSNTSHQGCQHQLFCHSVSLRFVCLYCTHQCRDWFFSLGPSDCINRQMTDTSEFLDEVTFSFSLFPLEKLGFFSLNIYISLKYSALTMLQMCSKMIELYISTYIIFEIIFHCMLLQDIDYSSLCYTVNLCCLMQIYFSIINLAFYLYEVK